MFDVAPPPLFIPSRPAIVRAHEGDLNALKVLEREKGIRAILPGMVPAGVRGNKADPYFDNVILLLHFDGADGSTTFTDSSSYAHVPQSVSGNVQIDTAQSKFGGSSGLWDGSGDWIYYDDATTFALGTGDFTIEMFVRRNTTGNQYICAFGQNAGWYPQIYLNGSNQLIFYANNSVRITGGTLTTGAWYHVALSRASGTTRMFIDGTQTGSNYTDTNNYVAPGGRPIFGANDAGNLVWNGWMDEIRITKGVYRYNANYSVPTEPFPNV